MGCVIVKEGNKTIIERFGRFVEVLEPGFHWRNPIGLKKAKVMNMRLQQLAVKVQSKTRDNVFVDLMVSVHYRVLPDSVDRAYYEMNDPEGQIRAYVFDVVRAEVPHKTLDEIFIVKEELSQAIKIALKNTMEKYGFEIVATPVVDIDPDREVKYALNEKTKQLNLRLAMQEKAQADKMVAILKAEGLAETTRIQAAADADSKHKAGEGLSRQRQAIIDGLAESVKLFQEGVADVSSKDVMDLIMITQYFDMMHSIGTAEKGSNTIFIPHSPSNVGDIAQQLRQGFLEGNAATATKSTRH